VDVVERRFGSSRRGRGRRGTAQEKRIPRSAKGLRLRGTPAQSVSVSPSSLPREAFVLVSGKARNGIR